MKKNIAQIFLLTILIIVIYFSWIFSPVLAAGDWWYYFQSMFKENSLIPSAWSTYTSVNGLGGQGYAYIPTYLLIALSQLLSNISGISWDTISRLLFYIPFIILSAFSSIFVFRKLFPHNTLWIFSPMIFIFNTYVLMLVGGGQIFTGISYGMTPLTIYLFIQIFRISKINKISSVLYVCISSLAFSLQCLFDLRIAFITAIAVGIYLLILLILKEIKIKNLFIAALTFLIAVLINLYWIAPLIFLGVDPIKQLGENYSSTKIVEFLSFSKLENSISLLHPYWPENIFGKVSFMKSEYLLLPAIAFSSLFFISKKKREESKYILFFCCIGMLGIFLGKGANEPFGSLYLWLFSHIPGFQLFRDSFKWYTLIALSYSVLIPYAIYEIYSFIRVKDKFLKSKIFNLSNLFLISIFIYILFLIQPAILHRLPGTFQSRSLPDEYIKLNKYLTSDQNFYRTLWIPNTMLFGYFTNNNPQISARDLFNNYDHKKLIKTVNSKSSRDFIEKAGVKYVIVPHDSEKEIYLTDRKYDEKKYKFIVENLNKIEWLKKDKEFGKVVVYKTANHKERFWCNCDAKISYKFIYPTKYELEIKKVNKGDKLIFSEQFDPNWIAKNENFSIKSSSYEKRFNSFEIPTGSYKLEVFYESQNLINKAVMISVITFVSTVTLLIVCLFKIIWK